MDILIGSIYPEASSTLKEQKFKLFSQNGHGWNRVRWKNPFTIWWELNRRQELDLDLKIATTERRDPGEIKWAHWKLKQKNCDSLMFNHNSKAMDHNNWWLLKLCIASCRKPQVSCSHTQWPCQKVQKEFPYSLYYMQQMRYSNFWTMNCPTEFASIW